MDCYGYPFCRIHIALTSHSYCNRAQMDCYGYPFCRIHIVFVWQSLTNGLLRLSVLPDSHRIRIAIAEMDCYGYLFCRTHIAFVLQSHKLIATVIRSAAFTSHLHCNRTNGMLRLSALPDSHRIHICLLYTSPSPRDLSTSRMPSSA